MGLRKVEIDGHADHHRAVAVCLAKAVTTAWGGAINGNLFVPRSTFDLFDHVEPRQMHRTNSVGDPAWVKMVEVSGLPYVRLTLTTIEAPE